MGEKSRSRYEMEERLSLVSSRLHFQRLSSPEQLQNWSDESRERLSFSGNKSKSNFSEAEVKNKLIKKSTAVLCEYSNIKYSEKGLIWNNLWASCNINVENWRRRENFYLPC